MDSLNGVQDYVAVLENSLMVRCKRDLVLMRYEKTAGRVLMGHSRGLRMICGRRRMWFWRNVVVVVWTSLAIAPPDTCLVGSAGERRAGMATETGVVAGMNPWMGSGHPSAGGVLCI